jgi:penicillin-binding protein-related factor A (putative recombinase)
MPEIMKLIKKGMSFEKIGNSLNCVSQKCSKVTIHKIIKEVENGTIDPKKIGTRKQIRNNTSNQFDYTKVCYELLYNFVILKYEGNFSINNIKKAYKHFSKIIHPDVNKLDSDSNRKFICLEKALKNLKYNYHR